MACGSCIAKLAFKLLSHHKHLDLIRAFELAEKGVSRVEAYKARPLNDPYDYSQVCNPPTGQYSCYGPAVPCTIGLECINVNTCACSCPAPSKAHSHLEANECVGKPACSCDQVNEICVAKALTPCTISCSGACRYHCDDGYVWNPATQQCELVVAVKAVLMDGLVFVG